MGVKGIEWKAEQCVNVTRSDVIRETVKLTLTRGIDEWCK